MDTSDTSIRPIVEGKIDGQAPSNRPATSPWQPRRGLRHGRGTYRLAKENKLPAPVVNVGGKSLRVPTAALLRALGIPEPRK